MANFNSKNQGIIECLSDFWLLYFKEIDQLKTIYQGMDVLVGQSYLDVISLLMNNSVQDAPLFNKEFFKLIQIKETETKYLQGTNPEGNRFIYLTEDNLVTTSFLNNKIFSVTASLERDIDYWIGDHQLEFLYDPMNAYVEQNFGTGNSIFKIRNRSPLMQDLRISLVDDGTTPIHISRTGLGNDIVIQYDGLAHTGTGTSKLIVQAINIHPEFSGLLFAELALTDGGNASPAATAGFVPLIRTAKNSLDGFATRNIEQRFGAKFTSTAVPDWVAADVQKGDILRLLSGPNIGVPQEFIIDLVRKDALYVAAGTAITHVKSSDKTEFRIVREPRENKIIQMPLPISGVVVGMGTDGVLNAETRQLSVSAALFSPLHKGDIVELLGGQNTGYAQILSVVNATTVILALTSAANETSIPYNILSTYSTILNDGVFTNIGDGTAEFTSASAPFTADTTGTVIRISRAGILESYEVIEQSSATSVILAASSGAADGVGLTWGWASQRMPPATLPYPQIKKDSVIVQARRALDEQAVQIGRDYLVKEDTAQIQPLTVWRTATDNVVDFSYRLSVVSNTTILQSGTDGTITRGASLVFTAPTAAFTYYDIGQALTISNSGLILGATNNSTFYISEVINSTTATITGIGASTIDPNNGSLHWALLPRGTFTTDNVSAFIQETSFWAPDAMVDRFHLYQTFGYLINRQAPSSENYRSLIRGIFQLFMLGPTLERFESAINIVAGIPVIRDDGEILIDYTTGASQSGNDGVLDNTTRTFSAPSANFTVATEAAFIYVDTGLNPKKLYKIAAVLSPTQVLLNSAVISEGPISWELTSTGIQTVTTSRRTYTFARYIPMRRVVTDPANIGSKIFRAFEVLTDVFTVTDYVESPTWWETTQIPPELWQGESSARRQVAPTLFENVIGANDDPHFGDPGFIIGADSLGFIPPIVEIYNDGGLGDGTLTGDVLYPFSNNVYFTTTTNALFTENDVGNYVVVNEIRYRILERISSTRVKLEAFTPVVNATDLPWAIESQPAPMRHKASFVIMDTWLKYQMFQVTFNPVLLGTLSAEFIQDLEDLVYVAKPAYTYIVVTPSSLIQEIIRVTEDLLEVSPRIGLGGSGGENIAGDHQNIIIGGGWRIGGWFRYVEHTAVFNTPNTVIENVLGVPDSGYQHYVTKFLPDYTAFTNTDNASIQFSTPVNRLQNSGIAGKITQLSPSDYVFITEEPVFLDVHVGAKIYIPTSTVGNAGYHFIGRILSPVEAVLGTSIQAPEIGLTWQLYSYGSSAGTIQNTAQGECLFTDTAGLHKFNPEYVGTYIRFIYTGANSGRGLRIAKVTAPNSNSCKLAEVRRVHPLEGDPDILCQVTGNTLVDAFGYFDVTMGRIHRAENSPREELRVQYYVVFSSGVNAGQRRSIESVTDSATLLLQGAPLIDDSSASYYMEVETAPQVTAETTAWEHIQLHVIYDENTIDLSNVSSQSTATGVSFVAYGVREPLDPKTATMAVASGDTYYSIGMSNPRLSQGRTRTSRDVDINESPLQISVENVP